MKKKCVFVIGPESSGSTLVAQLISEVLNGADEWNGRGFNCCNSASCDKENNFSLPCKEVEHLICHRSLPFMEEAKWPPLEKWQSVYDAHFIICTRDATISKRSVRQRFGRKPETIEEHQKRARVMIGKVLKSESKSFIWSYETFMYLQEDYFRLLCDLLGVENSYFTSNIKDANLKYINSSELNFNSGIAIKLQNVLKRLGQ
jgi:hypothetical protein